ncbi:MAG: FecR family protein [Gallionella sp.]|nr:FecR family protein [Gallionella sp.]
MSNKLYIAKASAFILMVSVTASAWADRGYIQDTAGSVSIANGKETPRLAVINDTVTSGTVIRTGDNSYAVLKFDDGQVANLEPNTTFQVRNYTYDPQLVEKSNIVFSMFKGGMRFVSGLIGQRNPKAFRLATPNATVGIRGTDFLLVIKNGQTYIKVLSGSVNLTNAAGPMTFTAGQTALVTSATAAPTVVAAAAVPAGTFTGAIAINLEEALAAQAAAGQAATLQAIAEAAAAEAAATQVAGGEAAGGAAAATTTAVVATGVSATTIAIGVGIAAGVAALVNTTSTTSH